MSESGPPNDKASWKGIRTCSRVSSGVCEKCNRQAFFSAWRNGRRVLCSQCFEEIYEPGKAAKRKRRFAETDAKRKADLALALEGKLPGATVSKNGTVWGPPEKFVGGLVTRQVLREPTFDTETFESKKEPGADKPSSLFSNFDKFTGLGADHS